MNLTRPIAPPGQSAIDTRRQIRLRFNPALFNSIYWLLEDLFSRASIRFIWVYGGSSASKTFSVVQLLVKLMISGGDQNTLVLRKYAVDIKDSIYEDFKNVINSWGLQEFFTLQINYIRCDLTGSYVRFRGLDDSEKVKGIAGFRRVVLEEVSQFDYADLKQLRKRLRGRKGQQIIGIFNPISESHWIKTEVFDLENMIPVEPCPIAGYWLNDKGNTAILKTNYLDNKYIVGPRFVDQHTIDDFEKDKQTDPNYYRIYGLGDWGKIRTGGEFWKDFSMNLHQTKVGWCEDMPLHVFWDENVNPYLTCQVWQIYGIDNKIRPGKKLAVQVAEICLPDPNNRVLNVCREFKGRFPAARVKGVFVGGDRTSIKEDTKLEKGENFFSKVLQNLAEYRPQLRMQTVNPSIVQSAGFVNACYRGETEVEILINENCLKSLYDYQYSLEDSDGTLKKTMVKNKTTGVSYQEFGHCSDVKRYLATTTFGAEYDNYLRGRKGEPIRVGRRPPSKNSY